MNSFESRMNLEKQTTTKHNKQNENYPIKRLYFNPPIHMIILLPKMKGTSLSMFESKITPLSLEIRNKNMFCSKSFATESAFDLILI